MDICWCCVVQCVGDRSRQISGPLWRGNVHDNHCAVWLEGHLSSQHIFGSNPEGFDDRIARSLLGVYPWQVEQPANPPTVPLLHNCSVFHLHLTYGTSRSRQIFRANSSTISVWRGTCVFKGPLWKMLCLRPSRSRNAPWASRCFTSCVLLTDHLSRGPRIDHRYLDVSGKSPPNRGSAKVAQNRDLR